MIVLVIGMHRSGTSLISRAMKVFGIEHGDQLLIGPDNAKGHWEDLDLLQMNDLLLGHLGKTWSTMSMISSGEINRLLSSELRTQAAQLIVSKLKGCDCYGFKDPRTTILLPFWQQVLADCELKPVYLFVIRQPRAVIESLSRRDHFEVLRSAFLWINYNLSAMRHLLQCHSPVSVIDYNELLTCPQARLRTIADQAGLSLIEDELEIFVNDFLDHSLNHSKASGGDACDFSSDVPPLADAIYDFLLQTLDSPELMQTSGSSQMIQAWFSQHNGLQAVLRLADGDFQRAEAAVRVEAECRQARHDLSIIHRSTSWRLTAPMRWLKDLLHSILPRGFRA